MQSEKFQSILEFAQAVKTIGTEGLNKEFLSIPWKDLESSFAVAREPNNVKRNRYLYFLSFDASRVVLSRKTGGGSSASDFINANFVDGYEQENAYIATQGDLELAS